MNWLKRHSLILSVLFLYFSSVWLIYVEKQKAKEPYLSAMYARSVIVVAGKHCPKEKVGSLIVKAIFKDCPTSHIWGELVAEVDFRCDSKVIGGECRPITRKDFYINDDGLVIK